MNNKTTGEIVMALILGVACVFGLVLALAPLITGCASKPPATHEEWAAYCMSFEGDEFVECLQKWNEWEN